MSQIMIYKCTCDRKKLIKHDPDNKRSWLSPICDTIDSFRLKEPVDVLKPVVTISRDTLGKNWAKANYAQIPMFGRFYFINNPGTLHDGLVTYELSVDPLQSYMGDLLNTPFEISRSESVNSKDYIDPEKAIIQRRVVQYLPAKNAGGTAQGVPQSAANTKKYFITVAGG